MSNQPHVTSGKCWCGYLCGKLPTKDEERKDYSRKSK